MDGTTNTNQHGLQSDNLGFLVGQRRIERITANIAQDTQEIVRLLKGMIQDRALSPPNNQMQGLAIALIRAQRRATTEITGAIRALAANAAATPRPTVDVGGGDQTGTASRTIPNQPTVDVGSADLPRNDPPTTTDTSASPPNTPDSADSVSNATNATDVPPSTRTDYVRDARGRFVPRNQDGIAPTTGAAPENTGAAPENTDGRVNNGRKRSANGRFEGGGGDSKSWLDSFKDAVSGGVSTGMADTKGIDPMVDAVNELGGMLSPVKKAAGFAFKPISMLMKRNKRNEPLPAEQERHNREERKFWGRLVDAVKAQGGGNGFFANMGKQAAIATAAVAAVAVAAETIKDAGQAINDGLNKTETGRTVMGAVGEGLAHVAAFFGSEEAQRAIDANAAAKAIEDSEKPSKPVGDMTWRERWLSARAAAGSEDARAELRDRFPDNPAGLTGYGGVTKPSYFIGDSIAKGHKDANRAPGDAVVGRSPKAVLEAVRLVAEKNLDVLKNSDVYLSSGLSNNPDDLASVEAQLKQLQAVGARVKLYGISNKFPKGDPKAMNASLEGLAAKYGATFLGGFDPSADNVHPRAYRPLASTPRPAQAGTSGRPAQNGRAPRNASAYDQIMREEYARAGFSPDEMAILKGQVHVESGFNPLAKSPANAEGLSQFMPATARQYGVQYGDSPTAIRSQVAGQAKYMTYLLNRYNGDWEKALSGYNAGEGNTDSYIKAANRTGRDWKSYLRTETRNYLQQVPERAKLYRGLAQSVPADVAPTVAATTTTPEPTTPVPIVPATPEPAATPTTPEPEPEPEPVTPTPTATPEPTPTVATVTKLPETSLGLAKYADAQSIPAAMQPPMSAISAASGRGVMVPAARVVSLPINTLSARQAPNLPAMPPIPKVKEQVSSPAPQVVTIAQSADSISQNLGDRALAHAVTGGLGMRGWEG